MAHSIGSHHRFTPSHGGACAFNYSEALLLQLMSTAHTHPDAFRSQALPNLPSMHRRLVDPAASIHPASTAMGPLVAWSHCCIT
jgi:hypothetical protein